MWFSGSRVWSREGRVLVRTVRSLSTGELTIVPRSKERDDEMFSLFFWATCTPLSGVAYK